MNAHYQHRVMGAGKQSMLLEKWKPLLSIADQSQGLSPLTNENQATMVAQLMENQQRHFDQYGKRYADLADEMGLQTETVAAQSLFTAYGNADPVFNDPNASIADCEPCPGQFGNSVKPTNNDFYARGDARLPSIIMPMIRRTYPELLANEIVGVQPMSGPVGMAFAMRFKYDGEHLACFTPDGGCTINPEATASHPHRSFGQESGYQFLNTAHTGLTSAGLSGLGAGSCAEFIPEDQGVADLLKNCECSTAIPQMGMCIEKTAVEAGCRKLAFKFSLEAEQDLANMHGINLENEMINHMQYELQAEIDREILMRMIQCAISGGEGRGYSFWSPASADGRWAAERTVALINKIRREANLIQIRNRMGCANFLVTTPNVASLLEGAKQYKDLDTSGSINGCGGNAARGTLGNLKVFVDTRTEAQFQAGLRGQPFDYILLGYKGRSASETGLVYLPYIPIIIQKTMGPNDFSPRVGMMTRYSIAENLFGAENFYHLIIIKNLNECFTQDCVTMF